MTTDKHDLAAAGSRLHALDAVRAGALLLGVVLHATMSFFPGPQAWLVKDQTGSTVLSAAFFVIHMLRMLTFFLIAGFVARASFGRLGSLTFFSDRLRRIGLPLAIGWPILFAALLLATGTPVSFGEVHVATFPLMHLWFLYLLLGFYGVLAVVHTVLRPLPGPARGLDAAAGRAAQVLLRPWTAVLLAAPVCAALYVHPYWVMWFGIPTPDTSLLPNRPAIVAYGLAFWVGWLVQPRPDALGLWARRWPIHLVLALACTGFCLAKVGAVPLLMPAPQGMRKLVFAASYSLGAWCWALALVGMAQRFLDRPHALRRYLADASYWIYLVHLPLVVALQRWVAPLAWPWPVKFAAILAAAFALMLLTYSLFVRRTFVGVMLNGRRKSSQPLAH